MEAANDIHANFKGSKIEVIKLLITTDCRTSYPHMNSNAPKARPLIFMGGKDVPTAKEQNQVPTAKER